jgi:hypothetical protein
VNWIINQLREASTWRGIVWLLTVSGVVLRPDQVEAIMLAGMTFAGLLGVFLKDKVRDPNERTRKTDEAVYIPQFTLVGRSESTDAPRVSDTQPVIPDRITLESLERMRQSQLPPDSAIQSDERGPGWNG